MSLTEQQLKGSIVNDVGIYDAFHCHFVLLVSGYSLENNELHKFSYRFFGLTKSENKKSNALGLFIHLLAFANSEILSC